MLLAWPPLGDFAEAARLDGRRLSLPLVPGWPIPLASSAAASPSLASVATC